MHLGIARFSARRVLFTVLGVLSLVLAFVGVFLPGLPTTEFVIAASYLFGRSSPTLDDWLRRNRWFGPALRRFSENRGMTLKSKVLALTSMWVGQTIGWYTLSPMGVTLQMMMIALALAGTATLLFYVRTTEPIRSDRRHGRKAFRDSEPRVERSVSAASSPACGRRAYCKTPSRRSVVATNSAV